MGDKFPVIKIRGTAEERGRQHGSLLKERIHETVAFYQHSVLEREGTNLATASLYSALQSGGDSTEAC